MCECQRPVRMTWEREESVGRAAAEKEGEESRKSGGLSREAYARGNGRI